MCLDLTFPIYLQVSRDLLFCHYFFAPSFAGGAHRPAMWDATFKLVFINSLA